MADIDQIIAGGAGAGTRADFSGIADIPEAYWKGKDRRYVQEGRDLFQGGVPKNEDGSVNWAAISKALIGHGDVGQGVSTENVGIARDQLRLGAEALKQSQGYETGQPPQAAIISPPSPNRSASAVVAPPLNKGGVQGGAGSPHGDQPGSIVGLVSAAGIPDDKAGPVIAQIAKVAGIDPNAAVPAGVLPRIQSVLQAFLQRNGSAQAAPQQGAPGPVPIPQTRPPGAPQIGQPMPGSSAPIQPTLVPTQAIQGQPPPVTAASTGTTAPDIPSRIDQGIALYSAQAMNPALPESVRKAATARLEFLQKQKETTPEQKNFIQAKLEGFPGTMQDYQTKVEADKTHATESAKSYIKKYDAIQENGTRAQVDMPQLQLAKTLMADPNFYSGVGEKYNLVYKRLLSQFGDDPNAAVPQEAFRKIISAGILDQIKAMAGTGPVRVAEMKIIKDAAASQDNTPQSNRLLVELHLRLQKRAADIADMAQTYNNGRLDSGFDRRVSEYDRKNPIIADKEIPDFRKIISGGSKGPTALPAGQPIFSSPSDVRAAVSAGKLKSGDPFWNGTKTLYVP